MRLAPIADVHVGNHQQQGGPIEVGLNDRCRLVLGCLMKAVELANEHEARLLVLGDLMDTTKPTPQMLSAVAHILAKAEEQPIVLKGNHDSNSMARGDHSLGVLKLVADVVEEPTIIRDEPDGPELWLVPFQPGDAAEWLPERLRELSKLSSSNAESRVLGFHLGIADNDTPPWLMKARDKIHIDQLFGLMVEHDIGYTYAGNWHDLREWSQPDGLTSDDPIRFVIQCSALCPTGFNNPGLRQYGRVHVYESKHPPQTYQIDGPRFIKVSDHELDEALKSAADVGKLYVHVVADPTDLDAVTDKLEKLKADGTVVGFKVTADEVDIEIAAKAAAQKARSATTLSEAVQGFVEKMTLPKKVSREQVLVRTWGYL